MKLQVILPVAILGLCIGQALGQGRAIPIDSEEFITDRFLEINPSITYDRTNFLVDLSGTFAGCDNIGRDGFQEVYRDTPLGESIRALIGTTSGQETHVNAVVGYITDVVQGWMRNREVIEQVRVAESFGCSVRPGCRGRVSVACLFSPAEGAQGGQEITRPLARAFTRDQYDVAEAVLGQSWDRSYTLENLSGMETSCGMIDEDDWSFAKAVAEGAKRGLRVNGLFGQALNRGSTEAGMIEVLRTFNKIRSARQVGCSIIPDCKHGYGDIQDMFIVVSCLYVQ